MKNKVQDPLLGMDPREAPMPGETRDKPLQWKHGKHI